MDQTDQDKPRTVKDTYLDALTEIAAEHGHDHALYVAAQSLAALWGMISPASYRLPPTPLLWIDGPPAVEPPDESAS